MGPGIVDAFALLNADLDSGRETEGPIVVDVPAPADRSMRGFALEAIGPSTLQVRCARRA